MNDFNILIQSRGTTLVFTWNNGFQPVMPSSFPAATFEKTSKNASNLPPGKEERSSYFSQGGETPSVCGIFQLSLTRMTTATITTCLGYRPHGEVELVLVASSSGVYRRRVSLVHEEKGWIDENIGRSTDFLAALSWQLFQTIKAAQTRGLPEIVICLRYATSIPNMVLATFQLHIPEFTAPAAASFVSQVNQILSGR